MNQPTPKFGEHANRIGHWNEGPETFVIIKARNLQLGVQTYGPPPDTDTQERQDAQHWRHLMANAPPDGALVFPPKNGVQTITWGNPDTEDATLFRALRELMGYVQNGTDTTVKLYQDDATMDYVVKVGDDADYAPTLKQAIELAAKEHNE